MPRLIETVIEGEAIDLDALVDWCETSGFDPGHEEGLAQAAPMLAALARNRDFLADFAVAELKTRCRRQRRDNPYSAQVLLLRPPGRYVLRAAFWPAARDHVVRMGGTAPFLYGVPHDHGFDFLTIGYLGPGYWSDYYDYDGNVAGVPGEAVRLRFVERSRLCEGKMLLYRANRDVHAQLPADSLSVSLNILGTAPDQGWRRQFRFDTAQNAIAECMTLSSAQMLLELAVTCGNGNACDLAEDFATRHPVDMMRLTAWDAIGAGRDPVVHWEAGTHNSSPLIRHVSSDRLRNLENGQGSACIP